MSSVALRLALAFICVAPVVEAQVSSLISIYGLGQPVDDRNVTNRAMGGVANAVTHYTSVNVINPASYGYVYNVENRRVFFDVAAQNDRVSMELLDQPTLRSFGTTIGYVAVQMPVKKAMGIVFAFQPQGLTSYTTNMPGQGATPPQQLEYKGSVNQVLVGYGATLGRWSMGVNVGYLFAGKSSVLTRPVVESNRLAVSRKFERRSFSGVLVNAGVLYAYRLITDPDNIAHTILKVGGRFEMAPALFSRRYDEFTLFSQDPTGQEFPTPPDLEGPSNFRVQHFPAKTGIGLTYEKELVHLLSVDVDWERWAPFVYGDEKQSLPAFSTQNVWRVRLGGAVVPDYQSSSYAKHIAVSVGGYYGLSPLVYQGVGLTQWALTAGASFPIKKYLYTNQAASIRVALEFVRLAAQAVQQNTIRLTVGVSLSDLWFLKSYRQ